MFIASGPVMDAAAWDRVNIYFNNLSIKNKESSFRISPVLRVRLQIFKLTRAES